MGRELDWRLGKANRRLPCDVPHLIRGASPVTSLWSDQRGGIITTELVLVFSVLSAAAITGLTTVRDSVVQEAHDVARTVQSIDQSYGVSGVRSPSARTAGSSYTDVNRGIAFYGAIE